MTHFIRPSAGPLLSVWLLLLAGALSVSCCPTNETVYVYCKCEDSHNGIALDCSGRYANQTLQVLRENQAQLGLIQQLDLKYAGMTALSSRFLNGLYVKKLDVSHNEIASIDDDAFYGLETVLQSLIANHNNVTDLPAAALNGMTALLTLDLSNNSIGNLNSHHQFRSVPKLFDLNLANNKICDIHKSAFDEVKNSVQTLNLGRNCLNEVPASAIRGFQHLLALHLHNNEIDAVKPLAFMNLPMLNLINLAGNKIRTIHRQAFLNVPSMRLMYLSENKLVQLSANQFRHFQSLEMLDLTTNLLETIPTDGFSHMPKLNQLYLGENRLSKLEKGAFKNSSLVILLMPGNRFTELTEDTFDGLESVQQMSLKGNQIASIHQNAFYNMPSLVMLDLSNNQLLDLPPATFLGQLNIFLVDLSGNKLLRTPYGAFNRKVMTVVLKENPLVCTERVHMLQQGVGVFLPGTQDKICGGGARPADANSPLDLSTVPPGPGHSVNVNPSSTSFVQATQSPHPTSIIRPVPTVGDEFTGATSQPFQPGNLPGFSVGPLPQQPRFPQQQQLPTTGNQQPPGNWFGEPTLPNGAPLPPIVDRMPTPQVARRPVQVPPERNVPQGGRLPAYPPGMDPNDPRNWPQPQPTTAFPIPSPSTVPDQSSTQEPSYPRTIRPYPVPFLKTTKHTGPVRAAATPRPTLPPGIVLAPNPLPSAGRAPLPEWTQPPYSIETPLPPPGWGGGQSEGRGDEVRRVQQPTSGSVPPSPFSSSSLKPGSGQTFPPPGPTVPVEPSRGRDPPSGQQQFPHPQAQPSPVPEPEHSSPEPIVPSKKTIPTKKPDPFDLSVGDPFPYESADDKSLSVGGPGSATTTIVVCLSAVAIVMVGVFITLCVVRHKSQISQRGTSSSGSSAAARTSAYVAAQAAQMNFAAANYGMGTNGRPRPASTLGHATNGTMSNNAHTWIYTPGSYTSASNYYK